MKKSYIKSVLLIAAFSLAAASLYGCTSPAKDDNSGQTTDSSQVSENSSKEGNAGDELKPIEFSVFINGGVNAWDGWGTDPISTEFTNKTGVSLKVSSATTTDNSQINAMIASGDLTDIVVYGTSSPLRQTLWKQGFLQPINGLMDKYIPEMAAKLPKDMDKIYQESDGNFYMFVQYYSDIDKIAAIPGTSNVISGFTINDDMYKEIGSPEMKTLEQYRAALKLAKQKYPDLQYPFYEGVPLTPQDPRNSGQLVSRAFGGTHINSIAEDGTVHLNFRDESYKKAMVYINSLYREGLVNPENFTVKTEEQYADLVKNQKVFSTYGQPFMTYKWNERVDGPYAAFEPPTDEGVKMTLNSVITTIGYQGTSITTACKDPERAIKFFDFYMSDEGQMLMYHGIEGKDYEMVDGMPKNLPEKAKMWTDDFAKMQKEMGIINYNLCFAVTNWADMLYYYWMNVDKPSYKQDAEINNKYAVNERINTLIMVPSDSDFKVTETKIFDLWASYLPKMYLAETEAKCLEAYNELIAQAEKSGLLELEAEYTKSYQEWLPKIK